MKATEAKLLDFLKKSPQFVIPIYQRTYSWTEPQCRQLWDDILRAGRSENISAHFIGSIVYIEKGLYQVSSQSPLLVIDGQQRLTTATLIIEALSRRLGDGEPIEGFSAKKLRNYYLLNPLEEGERGFKLLLTQTDKQSLLALLKQKPLPAEHSLRVKENFEFFEAQVRQLGDDLTALCNGLAKLIIVDISLSRDQDNPQLIFESMNSTGRELSQADLIRNFVLMGLEPTHQTCLYEDHWRPMEVAFGQEGYGEHFDWFMRHYLTVKTGDIPKIDDVYEAFKAHARQPAIAEQGVDALVADIRAFGDYYCAMALGKETDKELAVAFQDLRELKVDVAYPFLMELYHDYVNGTLPKMDFLQAVRLVEAYVFRRAVCAIPTNSLNKTFATFGRVLKKDRYRESIQAHLLTLPSYRRFPGDEEFKRELTVRDLYNFRSRSYWLRRLENFGRKERVPVNEYTIEHILPQNDKLSAKWREVLGPEWQRVQETWLHTLGNLTLTGYNAEYSDRPFAEKRDMKGGFKESPLRLNEGLGGLDAWDEEEHPLRVAIVCAMWLTGFDVPSLATLYLDKPLKAHTLMQAIARANRVNEGKNNGLIVDYCGILKYLRKALATFAGTQPGGEGGEIDPARPEEELLADLAESIALARTFLEDRHVVLNDVIQKTGFARNAAIVACKEAANENDESRKRFEVMCREVFKKFKACINVQGVNAHRSNRDAINIIYKSLQQDREQADITDIIQQLHQVVDEAIEVRRDWMGDETKLYDISKIDFDRLRKEFDRSPSKHTTVQNLRLAVEQQLQRLLLQNPLRTDFQQHYERIVDEYNREKNRATIEKTFEALFRLVRNLNEEEHRAIREGLDEESLAIFDLLKKPELSSAEIKRIKKVAVDLLDRLKREKLRVDHWRDKEATRDAVRLAIRDYLWDESTGLPVKSFDEAEVGVRAENVFRHIYRAYPKLPSPFYSSTVA